MGQRTKDGRLAFPERRWVRWSSTLDDRLPGDPDGSFVGQIVTMTYPLIGNYGVNEEDVESREPRVEGFVVRESSSAFSSWRACQSLPEYLTNHRIMGVEGIDTRALTRHLRLRGAMKGILSTEDDNRPRLIEKAKASPDWSVEIW